MAAPLGLIVIPCVILSCCVVIWIVGWAHAAMPAVRLRQDLPL